MKKTISMIILILFNVYVFGQKTISEPRYKSSTHQNLKIKTITISETETKIEINISADDGWFCIDKGYYIKTNDNEIKYSLIKAEGLPYCPDNYKVRKGDNFPFYLYFQPIPISTKEIDLIEGCNENCVEIKGIVVDDELNTIEKKYSQARNAYYQKNYNNSLTIANELLTLIKDTLSLRYGQSKLLVADNNLRLGNLEKAEIHYTDILNSGLKDSTDTGDFIEPFANFKHKACQGIAYVYEYKKDWKNSLKWLEKVEEYPFYTLGPTHRLKNAVHILEWYVFLYEKMEEYDKAVYKNLMFIIEYGSGVRTHLYNRVNQRLASLVASHYNKGKFKAELDQAIENTIIENNKDVVIAKFKFLNNDYTIERHKDFQDVKTDENHKLVLGFETQTKNKDYFINSIKNHLYYDRIQQLDARSLTNKNGVMYYEGKPYTGKCYEFWVNGGLRTDGYYQNGILHDKLTTFYENGNKNEEIEFDNGNQNGKYCKYFDNGAIDTQGEYKNNKRNGNWIVWYPSGKQNTPLTFTSGNMAGYTIDATSDVDIPKQKKAEMTFVDDIENGQITIWYENGQTFRFGKYIMGKREGKWEEWNDKGEKVKQAKYKNGKLIKGDSFDNE